MTTVIKISDDFSRYPAGRYRTDGPYSGEKFREEILRPILEKNEIATIDLNDVRGYGSSFLEEAFGGLIRAGFPLKLIKRSFKFVSEDRSIIEEIEEYISDADEQLR